MDKNTLSDACISVLNINDHGSHTVPAPNLYPHQWLWDSCFAAIGWAQIDAKRAKKEIYSLLKGQWSNGMIPHMIFNMSPKYINDRNVWRSWTSSKSPDNLATSGITQPPVICEAIWRIGQNLEKYERIQFFKKTLPKIVKYHEWLYSDRDPQNDGLVMLIHPYEIGFDNTPTWMNQLREHSLPWWIEAIEKLKLNGIINMFRRDTRHVPSEQRIDNIEALVCWDVIRRLRRKNYDIEKILHRSLFVIEDVAFNSIFVRNNIVLIDIAKEARVKLPPELLIKIERSKKALELMWDETSGLYYSRDTLTNRLITEQTVASLMPLYAGVIEKSRADSLVKELMNNKSFWLEHPLPTVPKNVKYFNKYRYWQGPTWVNINWLIIDGLKRMGYENESAALKSHTLEMLRDHGIWEYYNPLNGQGLGCENFTWSAALALDLLEE